MKDINIKILVLFIFICLGAGALGSIFTSGSIASWYVFLNKPQFSPPNWLFAPVWTILYIMMGSSAYLVWRKMTMESIKAMQLFWGQLVVNVFWSIIFFGWRSPFLALVWIMLLWILVVLMILKFDKIDRISVWLLYPYFAWISFAVYLNYSIWVLNR